MLSIILHMSGADLAFSVEHLVSVSGLQTFNRLDSVVRTLPLIIVMNIDSLWVILV